MCVKEKVFFAVCVGEYLRGAVLERLPSKVMMGLVADDPVYKGYRLALVSASKEESLVRFCFFQSTKSQYIVYLYTYVYRNPHTHICMYIYIYINTQIHIYTFTRQVLPAGNLRMVDSVC